MTLVGKQLWATKQGKEFVTEAKLRAKRYFDACDRLGLITRWRKQYAMMFMRDPTQKGGYFSDSSVLQLGSRQNPSISIQIPEVRALMRQQLAFLLSDPVSFQVVASTGAQRNVMSSEIGEKALNYVFDEHVRPSMREFAELSFTYGMAATHLRWNSQGGDDVDQKVPVEGPDGQPIMDPSTQKPLVDPSGQVMMDPQTGQPQPDPNTGTPFTKSIQVKSGAPYVDVCDPSMFAMDPLIGTKANWIIGFQRTNLFVVAGQYASDKPELYDAILAQATTDEFAAYRLTPAMWNDMYGADEGDIIIMHVYYADSPELKSGRYAICVGDLVITEDDEPCPLQAGRLPIRPLITAKYTDNALSFADSFGVGPIEEALNRTRSSELNNYAYFGKQTRWREDGTRIIPGDDMQTREIVGPRGSNPPQMLPIQPMPSGADDLKRDLLESMPRISGYGDISRGLKTEDTTSGAQVQAFEAITARNLSLPQSDFVNHEQELANDMLSMLQNFGNTAFIAEIAGPDGSAVAREFSPQDLSTLRRLVAKAVPESMRGAMARVQLVEVTSKIEDPSERAKAIQMILRGDDEYGRDDARTQNLIAIENERLIVGDVQVTAAITQNHVVHMVDHQAGLDYILSQETPDADAIDRFTQHIMQHAQMIQDADPVACKALGYMDPPILPGNAAFVFAQRQQQAQLMLAPQQAPNPVTGQVDDSNPAVQQQAQQTQQAPGSASQGAKQ